MTETRYGMSSVVGDDMVNIIVVQAKTFRLEQEQVDWMLWELSKIHPEAWSKPVRQKVGIVLGSIIE